ncbi:cupin-like domain-containing protein [Ohtaekwangia koreensis]|uniref:Cupin-like domain-containing protein n=1 Tax=Ohtaekwangia koreensis TaxID=688867 RepID=A0A1T5M4Z3_9BACT|nr:cupin-like domain-containing protein [Ohtaekwangia koreensis]SKC83311.1 Cupin-like domain-containing protein [Ohtaekwangia koreensis]
MKPYKHLLDCYAMFDSLEHTSTFSRDQLNKAPVVFTSIMEQWPAYPKWNTHFFEDRHGDHMILADRMEDGQSKFIRTSLKNYIKYMRECDEPNPYYAKTSLHLATDMRSEYPVDQYFPCWYRRWYQEHAQEERKINLSNLYLGPAHALSPLHVDIWGTSFWNALFEGEKLWVFFLNSDEPFLYQGRVNPFTPDWDAFPLFRKAAPLIYIQRPGELVYCPGGIWHAVLLLKPCIALSENFINHENYQRVLQSFARQNMWNAYHKMVAIRDAYQDVVWN